MTKSCGVMTVTSESSTQYFFYDSLQTVLVFRKLLYLFSQIHAVAIIEKIVPNLSSREITDIKNTY